MGDDDVDMATDLPTEAGARDAILSELSGCGVPCCADCLDAIGNYRAAVRRAFAEEMVEMAVNAEAKDLSEMAFKLRFIKQLTESRTAHTPA